MGRIARSCSLRGWCALILLAAVGPAYGQRELQRVEKFTESAVAQYPKQSADGSPLRRGCGLECGLTHVDGTVLEAQSSVVAAPTDTTYSVHHRVGADLDGQGPQEISCFFIFNPTLPGAQDDVVTFDSLVNPEPLRTDLLGTVPTVVESDEAAPNGRRTIVVQTSAPAGHDLFSAGFESGGVALTDACFSIGLDDPLTWAGTDIVHSALLEFLIDGQTVLGPLDAMFFFQNPWNGVTTITLPGGAGLGYNGVRLTLNVEKSIDIVNDGCRGQIEITDGDTPFSTIGATTDGPVEPGICQYFFYSDVGSDIWFRYRATCTGDLTVDLCDSEYDTKFAVYDQCLNCPVDPGASVCNDDFCGGRSYAVMPVVQDQCVTIRVGGYLGLQGEGTLRLSCDVAPPPSGACCAASGVCIGTFSQEQCQLQQGTWTQGASCPGFSCPITPPTNDECVNAIRVVTGQAYVGRTTAATGTDVTPMCGQNDFKDVWHYWTADCTGEVSVTTCGSDLDFDTTLAAFTQCGGTAFRCDDDGCPLPNSLGHSKIVFNAVGGQTYYLRVAGHLGDTGQYSLTVEPCKNGCCVSTGACTLRSAASCLTIPEARPLGDGTRCLGDSDADGVDDACETCPNATIGFASPASGTVDARQPSTRQAATPRHGIGAPGGGGVRRESIVIVLDPPLADATGCFSLCETGVDISGPNDIQSVTYNGSGVYEMVLAHAIAPGRVTKIEYLGDGSSVEYTSHPANVDAGPAANGADVEEHIDCCLTGLCTPMWGNYSCDIDRSLAVTPADLIFLVDLLIGTQQWDQWNNTNLPSPAACP